MNGDTISTDVIARNYKPSFQLIDHEVKDIRKTRQNPIQPGISIGHKHISAGTFGCIVYGKNDAKPYILSNWHVLDGNNGSVGDDILQPGRFDDADTSNNKVGKLVKSHLGRAGDCAIASIENRSFREEVFQLGVAPKQLAIPELGDRGIKSGRTTSVTHGIVRRVNVKVRLDYGGSMGTQTIDGFEIAPDPNFPAENNEISMGGDSGSVWLASDKKGEPSDVAVGLHFAGEGSSNPDEHALACYLDAVFAKLDVIL